MPAAEGRPSATGQRSDSLHAGQLLRVAHGVDAGDAAVLHGDTDGRVELAADVDAGRGGAVEPDGLRLEIQPAGRGDEEGCDPLRTLDRSRGGGDQAATVGDDDDVGREDVEQALQVAAPDSCQEPLDGLLL